MAIPWWEQKVFYSLLCMTVDIYKYLNKFLSYSSLKKGCNLNSILTHHYIISRRVKFFSQATTAWIYRLLWLQQCKKTVIWQNIHLWSVFRMQKIFKQRLKKNDMFINTMCPPLAFITASEECVDVWFERNYY